MELRYKMQVDMDNAPTLIEETGLEDQKAFGRYHGLVEDYRIDDAEIVLVTSGTAA